MSNSVVQAKAQAAVSPAHRVSSWLFARPRARLALLLSAPMAWLVAVYIVALAALLITAFWTVDSFTGQVQMNWSTANLQHVVTSAQWMNTRYSQRLMNQECPISYDQGSGRVYRELTANEDAPIREVRNLRCPAPCRSDPDCV